MTSVAVVGAGLAGSAAAWQLARRGHEVVLLERTAPANPWGSSHGSARIFRYGYPDPFYAGLVVEARREWDALEAASGESLITPYGAVDHGSRRDPRRLAEVLAGLDVPHELLSAGDAAARWPGIRFDGEALWHEGAGVIDAERAVEAMVALARNAGAVVREGWAVAEVRRSGAGFRVVSEQDDAVEAEEVVVAAGGWLPDLLDALNLGDDVRGRFPALEVRREQAMHFPYRDDPSQGAGWPSIIHKTDAILAYALPGGRDAEGRGHKVALYNDGPVIPSAAAHDRTIDEDATARLLAYVSEYLPGLDASAPYAATTCLFTNTPDEEFVIDRVDGLTILSPCSGHGAKFAPLIGAFAARLVEGGTVPARMRPLSVR